MPTLAHPVNYVPVYLHTPSRFKWCPNTKVSTTTFHSSLFMSFFVVVNMIKLESDNEVLLLPFIYIRESSYIMIVVFVG